MLTVRTLMTLTVMTVGLAAVGCRSAITEPLDALGVARGPGLVVVVELYLEFLPVEDHTLELLAVVLVLQL